MPDLINSALFMKFHIFYEMWVSMRGEIPGFPLPLVLIELFSNEHSLYIMYTVLYNIYRCVASFIVPFHDSTRLTCGRQGSSAG